MTPETRTELLLLASRARALADEKRKTVAKRKQPKSLAEMVDRMADEHYAQGYEHAVRFFEGVANLPSCARCGEPCDRSVKSPDSSHVWHVHQIADGELRCLEGA